MTAGASSTTSVKLWTEFGRLPLAAVMVITCDPPVPTAGVPISVPFDASVTPAGNVPTSVNVGTGKPVAVTLKLPASPTVKVVVLVEVMIGEVGGAVTVRLNA